MCYRNVLIEFALTVYVKIIFPLMMLYYNVKHTLIDLINNIKEFLHTMFVKNGIDEDPSDNIVPIDPAGNPIEYIESIQKKNDEQIVNRQARMNKLRQQRKHIIDNIINNSVDVKS